VPAERSTSHPAYLPATTDLDPEELRHERGDRDRLGVKSGGARMAVGPGGAVLITPALRRHATRCYPDRLRAKTLRAEHAW
jgi:hypothetical protein